VNERLQSGGRRLPANAHLWTSEIAVSSATSELQQAVGEHPLRGRLGIAFLVVLLVAVGIYSSFPHPTHDQATLRLVAAEARHLLAARPLESSTLSIVVPKDQWPSTIATLKPYSVIVRKGMVDITTKPFFDGGWGYGFATHSRNLTMLTECWSELGKDVYWHGPC
jgi:hypothetical protein